MSDKNSNPDKSENVVDLEKYKKKKEKEKYESYIPESTDDLKDEDGTELDQLF